LAKNETCKKTVCPSRTSAFASSYSNPKGQWHIASDDPTYQAWVEETMENQPYFKKIMQTNKRPENWPSTRYEQKAYKAGRSPIFWIFEKS